MRSSHCSTWATAKNKRCTRHSSTLRYAVLAGTAYIGAGASSCARSSIQRNERVHQPSRGESAVRAGDITPAELSRLLNSGEPVTVIDVREPDEWDFARIPTARLMPLATLPDAAAGIDLNADVVVYCHHGLRSDMAAQSLVDAGFRHVRNLVGGIDRWSREVDPQVPRYR